MQSFRWDGHGHAIISKVAEFYRKEVNTDSIFLVEEHKVRGHKVILCACSNYFQELLRNKSTEEEIPMENVKFLDLKCVFNFIYFGIVEVPENQVASFIKTAELLQIRELLGVNELQKISNLEVARDDVPPISRTTYVEKNSEIQEGCITLDSSQIVNTILKEELPMAEERGSDEELNETANFHSEVDVKESILHSHKVHDLSWHEDGGAESAAEEDTRKPPTKKPRACRKETFTCSFCSYSTSHKSHLNVHLRTHTKERPFSCNECDATFSHKISLQIHQHKHTGEKPYKCDVCSSSFSQLCSLKTHKRIHTGDKRYLCDVCSSSFTDYSNLKTHKRMHTGDKPYLCDVCSSSFTRLSSLKIHKRIHTGDKPYLCDVCSSSFSRLSNLKTHKRIHTGIKPYVCDVCSSSFSQLGTLKRHKRIHSGESSSDATFGGSAFHG